MKTFRHKAPTGKVKKKIEEDINDISNIEYDYNKIFALLYRKENDPFEKSNDLMIIENYNKNKGKDKDKEFKKDKESDLMKKDIKEDNKNENRNCKEFQSTCTCRKINKIERREENFRSFITAISNENTEDFNLRKNQEYEKININTENKNDEKNFIGKINNNNTQNEVNEFIVKNPLNTIEEEKDHKNKKEINTNTQTLNNFSIEEKEKSDIKIRKNNLNKSSNKKENKRESLNLGLEDFDENLKKKLEKNFEENGNTEESNEININVNDLTINLKSTNQAVKFSNDILNSEEEIKLKEDIEKIEKEKLNKENNNNKDKIKLREKCDYCKINRTKNTRSIYQKSFIKTNDIEKDLFLKNNNFNNINNYNQNKSEEQLQLNYNYNYNDGNYDTYNNYNNNNDNNFNYVSSRKHIRQSYFTRLICSDTWVPYLKKKSHNTIIIFDWDDTLLCTTFLTPNGIFYDNIKIDKKDLDKITKLESLTYEILKTSIECGDTFIITNAAPGWVEYSTKRFYPKVFPLLSKLNILSARGEFEKKFPRDSRQWKILTFLRLLKIVDINLITNFICLGDSVIEMEAAHIFASRFSKIYIKTVKFREYPSPEELYKQLHLISNQFYTIYSTVKNLTIKVERKNKPNTSKSNYTSFDNNNSNYDISQIRNSIGSLNGLDIKKK
jgi:hypothetical protein